MKVVRVLPCGTPQLMVKGSNNVEWIRTSCGLSLRLAKNNWITGFKAPTSCNFKIRVSWLTLSTTLVMSKNTAEVNIFGLSF